MRRQNERWKVHGLRDSLGADESDECKNQGEKKLEHNEHLMTLGVKKALDKHGVPSLAKQAKTGREYVVVIVTEGTIAGFG